MATVAELESRVAELEDVVKELREKLDAVDNDVDNLDTKVDELGGSVRELAERPEGGTTFERDEDGNITDHDGELAPRVDANGDVVHDPNH